MTLSDLLNYIYTERDVEKDCSGVERATFASKCLVNGCNHEDSALDSYWNEETTKMASIGKVIAHLKNTHGFVEDYSCYVLLIYSRKDNTVAAHVKSKEL